MAGMTKREGAKRVLDAQSSKQKLRQRIIIGSLVILIMGVGVSLMTRWEFGIAAILAAGLLFQYAIERMNVIIEASVANGIKALGWREDTELNEETLEKIKAIAHQ